MKGKAIIGILMAAIMVVSIFAATLPMVSAESRGDNFNHIAKQMAAQKVLIGQNLQFEGFDGTVAICRMVSGDIEDVYLADDNNRIYNVNWPTSGTYYVNYDAATKLGAAGTIEKTSDLSTRRSQRAQSLKLFQTPFVFSNVSAFSARSAVKLGGIVISLEKSIVPFRP